MRPADRTSFETYLNDELPQAGRSNFLLYWTGHGRVQDGDRVLFHSDYLEKKKDSTLHPRHVGSLLRTEEYLGYENVLILADVCGGFGELESTRGDPRHRQILNPTILFGFATSEGDYARTEEGHGAFTALVCEELTRHGAFPSNLARFEDAFRHAANTRRGPQFRYSDGRADLLSGNVLVRTPDFGSEVIEALYREVMCNVPGKIAENAFFATVCSIGNNRLASRMEGNLQMMEELQGLGMSDRVPTEGLVQFLMRVSIADEERRAEIERWIDKMVPPDIRDRAEETLAREGGRLLLIADVVHDLETGAPARLSTSLRHHHDLVAIAEAPTDHHASSWQDVMSKLADTVLLLQEERDSPRSRSISSSRASRSMGPSGPARGGCRANAWARKSRLCSMSGAVTSKQMHRSCRRALAAHLRGDAPGGSRQPSMAGCRARSHSRT